jgi:type II secretory pathway predicted ATPase ExeA
MRRLTFRPDHNFGKSQRFFSGASGGKRIEQSLVKFGQYGLRISAMVLRPYVVAGVVVTAAVLGGALYYGHKNWSDEANIERVVRTFEAGPPVSLIGTERLVERPQLHSDLKALLQPAESKNYVVVVGEHGTGKTTAMQLAVMSVAGGALYFQTPPSLESRDDFAERLAEVTGFSFYKWSPVEDLRNVIFHTKREDSHRSWWGQLENGLLEAASLYKKKHGRPMTLIIDDTDIVAKKHPGFLKDLQLFAKLVADKGTLRIGFVTSEGIAVQLMTNESAWSRAATYEVVDIDDEEAKAFLLTRGTGAEEAKWAVEQITGGRFALLNKASGMTTEQLHAWRSGLHKGVASSVIVAGMKVEDQLFKDMLQHGGLEESVVFEHVGPDATQLLVEKNILSAHPNKTYTFQARYVCWYFNQKHEGKFRCLHAKR